MRQSLDLSIDLGLKFSVRVMGIRTDRKVNEIRLVLTFHFNVC